MYAKVFKSSIQLHGLLEIYFAANSKISSQPPIQSGKCRLVALHSFVRSYRVQTLLERASQDVLKLSSYDFCKIGSSIKHMQIAQIRF